MHQISPLKGIKIHVKTAETSSSLQCFCRTDLRTLLTEDTFGGILTTARVVFYLNIHRTDLQTFPTIYAFFFITLDTKQGIIAQRFQKNRYRTDVFTESSVVFEQDGKDDANNVIENVSCYNENKHRIGISHIKPK